jgi:hypothetical protein
MGRMGRRVWMVIAHADIAGGLEWSNPGFSLPAEAEGKVSRRLLREPPEYTQAKQGTPWPGLSRFAGAAATEAGADGAKLTKLKVVTDWPICASA